ncbi:hypothetical protein [Deinococcus humi]|uniref:Uncharacterized protein n=1 Tax=Deinococcus humi TaxID=662880 RepID=A0A7W8NH71_9DEIO|nr:hypothetical protein [Deinococcus humi]MBB5364513.1 hypothetical protein [Deinococcus humi]GGO37990.1 hypothetical protein GCM10008949_43940 [Deinococcus humi]
MEAFIEAAFQKAFGPETAALPPVTDADFAPSQAEKYGSPNGQHRRSVVILNTSD